MDYTQALGLVAAAAITLANFPQAYKIIKTKSTKDISTVTYILLLAGGMLWVIYGIIRTDLPVILGNSISTLTSGFILILKYTPDRTVKNINRKIVPEKGKKK